jgi:PPK2 family polyphosphate:nucleotide phosphotransferase
MNYSKTLLVKPGAKINLNNINPDFAGISKDKAREITQRNISKLSELQELLYAEHKRSLLICLQAIDGGGKDSTIRHVFGAFNPQGCKVSAFKQPAGVERDHDFLWRAHCNVPAKGDVAIFNRSHYEEVLIARVHNLVPKAVWSKRYEQINAMEKILAENGTHILKFFLHISKDEQLKRFRERLEDPTKRWKISSSDYTEREQWDEYMKAFEDMLSKCSMRYAPWFVIPANHKWFRDLAISQIVAAYLEGLHMAYPKPAVDLKEIRKKYLGAKA